MKVEQILDSRELEEEIQELQDNEERDEDDEERLKILLELKAECECYGWEHGITFIHDYYFPDYARELAEECGYVSSSNNPLMDCIDWEKWSDMVQMDYSEVEIDGETYYYREA